ncbi:hypothetical protein GCT13_18995 [Paraburkholderia sp. CNPSo 3157]|uniref:Uncharacterized protein n=1 Tax=Paraburkholderia franconis TaxID=2654983 RepID=A0A7X1TH78_9BURK|nr:hypothetical protein [Paraburkholderia franconis]MPW18929.1 hypothetical protein [Paraburkholderia franconis]
MFHLISVPQDERAGSLEDIEQSLVRDTRLHVVEAHAVAELALQSVDALSTEQVASLGKRLAAFHAHLEREWSLLATRYELLLKADSTREFSTTSSPSQISNG